MDNKEFNERLQKAIDSLKDLPEGLAKDAIRKQIEAVQHRREHGRQTMDSVHESLDILRVHLQYLLLDLEATKRENAVLAARLKAYEGDDGLTS